MQQIVDYKNDAGNGYSNSLLCFMQLFIVSNKTKLIILPTTKISILPLMLMNSFCLFIN